jgi:hypothetical protein
MGNPELRRRATDVSDVSKVPYAFWTLEGGRTTFYSKARKRIPSDVATNPTETEFSNICRLVVFYSYILVR